MNIDLPEAKTESEATALIENLTSKKATFTAFNITHLIRQQYLYRNVQHPVVRDWVHKLFESKHPLFDGYERIDTGKFLEYRPVTPITQPCKQAAQSNDWLAHLKNLIGAN